MKRPRISVAALFVVIPTLLFAALVWMNWTPLETVEVSGQELLRVRVGLGRSLYAGLGEVVAATFVLGALLGVLAAWVSGSGRRADVRDKVTTLTADNRKLAAANRALEAALPVLRQGYDEALGLDPAANAVNTPLGDEDVDRVSIDQLALEDATRRQEARRDGV